MGWGGKEMRGEEEKRGEEETREGTWREKEIKKRGTGSIEVHV